MSGCRVRSGNSFGTATLLLSFTLACFSIVASAQQGDYPILTHADSAEIWFDRIVSPKYAAIVNGPEYYISFKGLKTHPFYKTSESVRSSLRYDHDLYTNIDLLYDSYGDMLVLKYQTSNNIFFIKLHQDLVQSFDLYGHHFKKYDEGIRSGIGAYFDVLFEKNQFAVVVKRRKIERREGSSRDYLEDDVPYILSDGEWIRITGKGSFTKIISKDQEKELTAFIKTNHIKVSKRKDEDLRKLGVFCYSLRDQK